MDMYKYYNGEEYTFQEWGENKNKLISRLKQLGKSEPDKNWIIRVGTRQSFGERHCPENRVKGFGILKSLRPKSKFVIMRYPRKTRQVVSGKASALRYTCCC